MARLQIYDGQDKLRDVELGKETLSLGRDPSNSIVLPDPSVSRRHAEIEPAGSFYLIRDNASTNGTFVNDMLVRVHLLAHGDIVRLGKYLLRVDARAAPGKESTRVRIEKLELPGRGERARTPAADLAVESSVEPCDLESAMSQAQHLRRLKRLNETIGYIHGKQELYSRIIEFFISELGVDRAVIMLAREQRSAAPLSTAQLRSVAARSCEESPDAEIVLSTSMLEQALAATGAFVAHVSEIAKDSAVMAAPLRDRDRICGVIYVDRALSLLSFDQDDILFFDPAVQQISIALSNAVLFEEINAERGKVQAIFSSLTDGILVTDKELKVTDCNIGAVLLLGLQNRNPIGRHFLDLLADFDSTPRPEHFLQEAGDMGTSFYLVRKGNPPPAASTRNLSGRISVYPREVSDPRGFVITLRDATEIHRLERLKSEFIGNVAHKLRTPVTVIEANLPLLHENLDNLALRQEILDDIDRNSGLLCHLLDKFVEFSALEIRSTGISDMPQLVSPRKLAENAIYRAASLIESKGVEVVNAIPADAPGITVRISRFTDALYRVIENAVKFSPESARVDIEAEASGSILHVHVTDRGPGIPREELESVFYVGHQVDRHGTGQVPGAGMGLTVARHLVQEHGGDIRIRSPFPAESGGARVTLIVPLKTDSADAEMASVTDQSELDTLLEVQHD